MMKYVIAALMIITMVAGVGVVHAKSQAPKTFNEVQVFRGDPPGKPYKVMGKIDLAVPAGMTRSQAVTLLKKRAFNEHQADAVINVAVTEKRTGGTPSRTVCPQTSSDCFTQGGDTFSENHASGTAVKWQ